MKSQLHVRCAVDVDDVGRPVRVTVAGQEWTVQDATLSRARRTWGLKRPARWYASCAGITLELYAREYMPGAPGLTWWWLVLPTAKLAPLNLQLTEGGRGVAPLEQRWVAGRTFAWLGKSRKMARDDEALVGTGMDPAYDMTCLMVRRLAKAG